MSLIVNIMSDTDDAKILTKKCTGECGLELALDQFDKLKAGKYGRMSYCKKCRKLKNQKLNYERKNEGTKVCKQCDTEKDVSKFSADKMSKDGLQTYCKDCQMVKVKNNASTLDGYINKALLDLKNNSKRNGDNVEISITKQDLLDLYNNQSGKCKLSGRQLTHEAGKYTNVSIDLIDSAKPYQKDNIRLVMVAVKAMKFEPFKDFILLCKDIAKNN